ncbi:transmembrane protein 18-domain-containing protein [Pilobolus umbonatus]|nr:transmembrane protein 18-domain-containing protein [Pilobolus umbonatus]
MSNVALPSGCLTFPCVCVCIDFPIQKGQQLHMNINELFRDLFQSISTIKSEAGLDNYVEHTLSFYEAIDWSEYWIMATLGFHVLCFVTTIIIRNKHTSLSMYFFFLLGMALLTQPLNTLGIQYWKSFSLYPYFDPSGIFIVSVYSFPLMFNAFVTLIFILKAVFSMLIQVKRAQLRYKVKANKQK